MALRPPTLVRFSDETGRFRLRPTVCQPIEQQDANSSFEDCSARLPVRFFVETNPYSLAGLFKMRRRLFGIDQPGGLYLMGTDAYGRDQFSRFLHGGRISLLAGVLAALIAVAFGLLLGSVAGYYGTWIDEVIMVIAELFLALPWLYLLFAVRAFLPLDLAPAAAFMLVIAIIGCIGWARPARLVRGVVLSVKEREYVLATRGFGASDAYILRKHVLPETISVALTQLSLLIPRYILAEITLSFLGLGINEPASSWGGMLIALQQYQILTSSWWMYLPALALVPTFLAYLSLSNEVQARTQWTETQKW
jgi:peptide/nickel transport system permease protein